jgi:trigger factor
MSFGTLPIPMDTSVEPLEGNKVRLHVAVTDEEFDHAIDSAFRKLARQVRIPGFRPGKAPRRILEARLGADVAREQALQDALPGYYAEAVETRGLDTIAPPEIDITAGADSGPVEFDAVVEVRPVIQLKDYDELRVEVDAPDVSDETVDAQVDALRERFADLEDSARPLQDGDFASIDIKGYVHDEVIDALSATDLLYEVGSGLVVDELDAELRGKRPGDILKFTASLPERFGERAGEEVAFQVLVKEAKQKVLPDATDEWASEASEFETIAELRDDIRTRLDLFARIQARTAVREKVLDAVADKVDLEVPDVLVREEMERRLHDFVHRLEHQGMTIAQYLEATGQAQETFVAGLRDGSTRAVKADLALRAVVAQEAIEVSDDEVDAEVTTIAGQMGQKPEKVRRDLDRRGALEALRSEIARGKALQFLIDHATAVDEEGRPLDLTLPDAASAGDTTEANGEETVSTPDETPDDEAHEEHEA